MFLLFLILCMIACTPPVLLPKSVDEIKQPVKKPTDPPVYVRLHDETQSPLLAQKVNVNFPPGGAVLQTAITSGLPFPVTVIAEDEHVNLQAAVAVQARDTTVAKYLRQLEGITSYRIRFYPEERVVAIAGMVTETWNLAALSGVAKFNARLGFESGDEDEEQSDSQTGHEMRTELEYDENVWDSIVDNARCILGIQRCRKNDGTVQKASDKTEENLDTTAWLVANRRLGTITAGGKPLKISHLDEWLKQLAADSLQSIQLDCVIFDIAKNENGSFGVDLNAVFGGDTAFTIQSAANADDSDNPWTIGALLNTGDFDMDLLIRSLSAQARAEVKSRARLSVTNGATAYLNTGEVFSYISGVETVAAEGVATTAFEQKRLQVGLELAITPRMIDKNGRILVEVIPILSTLLGYDVLNSGDDEISAPVVALRQLNSQAITRNGSPVVIGGLDWDRFAHRESGISKHLPFHRLLTSVNKERETRQLLIVITPRVVTI